MNWTTRPQMKPLLVRVLETFGGMVRLYDVDLHMEISLPAAAVEDLGPAEDLVAKRVIPADLFKSRWAGCRWVQVPHVRWDQCLHECAGQIGRERSAALARKGI